MQHFEGQPAGVVSGNAAESAQGLGIDGVILRVEQGAFARFVERQNERRLVLAHVTAGFAWLFQRAPEAGEIGFAVEAARRVDFRPAVGLAAHERGDLFVTARRRWSLRRCRRRQERGHGGGERQFQ